MPNLEKNKLEDALEHLKRLPRATPPPELLARIEAGLTMPAAKVIPLGEWRKIVAAALVILSLNATAMAYYLSSQATDTPRTEYAETKLISDYQLYY